MASPRRNRHVDAHRSGGRLRVLAAGALLGIVLSGCFTGQRPRFEDAESKDLTGRTEIDDVLERLDATPQAHFTAEYDILTRLGDRESEAVVVQAPEARRSITINSIRYVFTGLTVATCDLDEATCTAQITPQSTYGELFVDQDFYAATPAKRLRNDARIRIGDPVASDITIGGMPAQCVDVPVSGGTNRYCALESGPLALYAGNDLTITLTSYTDRPDESLIATAR